MPRYRATDPTGNSVSFEWYEDRAPTETDMDAIFAARAESGAGQSKLYGGSEAKLSPGTEGESIWAQAREAVSQAIFGSPDRAEARAAGIGLQPTTAEMLEMGGMAAGAAAATAAVGSAPT